MTLGTILVCLTTPDHAETLMKLAVPLARKHNAHLVGLHTLEALAIYPSIAMHIPAPAFESFNKSQAKEAEAIRDIFDIYTKNEDFPSEWRLLKAQSTSATDRMVESARTVDLVIMSHEDNETERYDQRNARITVIRSSGRPVIVVPLGYEGPTVGENILLGWSSTREAARASHDLLTVVDEGAAVCVLQVGVAQQAALASSDTIELANMYARHGLKVSLEQRDGTTKSVAEIINQTAFEKGTDLIVVGAFGHSKAYDFVVGAATYDLLDRAKCPVMFSF
jgi:nucleotide-binding universal stress UspA family protein